jgi:cell division protease FtsH
MERATRWNLGYLIVALMGVFLLHDLLAQASGPVTIPYSRFEELLAQRKVVEVVVGANELRGTLSEPEDGKRSFVTNRVEPELARKLSDQGVRFSGKVESALWPLLLSWLAPIVLFAAIWFFLIRRMARGGGSGGLMSIGKSKAKVYVETETGVRFSDVAGVDESRHELQEIVEFLRDPARYGRLGARMPKGVLLVGPPGTGKTLLAKAVAGEAGVPFFSISGSEFVEMFVGVGAARVRDLFEQARSKAPAIVFIDELDALGKARNSAFATGGHDEKEQTLNQLLVEMDGFDPASTIIILAATNRPEVLDPALLRAGRFDRQVVVDRPDRKGRAAILAVHAKKVKLAPDVALDAIAALTPGFSGADLANLVNEAALAATRRGADAVATQDFSAAVERLVAGVERRSRVLNPRDRQIVAVHEMGHALVAGALSGCDPVHKVSIIPRGVGALGYTLQRPAEDRFLLTREELENRMVVLLGGRAAEQVVFDHLSTGAADDLSRATDLARNMVARYGMHPTLGHAALEADGPTFLGGPPVGARRLYSEQTAAQVDAAVTELVGRALDRARALLAANRAVLDESAALLLEVETFDEAALAAWFARLQRPTVEATAA